VIANQRRRLIAAAGEILAERGLLRMTARLISRRARVSNYTFYEHFAGVDEVLEASFGLAARSATEAVGTACGSTPDFDAKVITALAAVLAFGKRGPAMAALFAPELIAVPGVLRQYEVLLTRLSSLLGDARQTPWREHRQQLDRLMVGGALALAAARVREKDTDRAEPDRLAEELCLLFD
jgi:AcrR family transcriptional regulator